MLFDEQRDLALSIRSRPNRAAYYRMLRQNKRIVPFFLTKQQYVKHDLNLSFVTITKTITGTVGLGVLWLFRRNKASWLPSLVVPGLCMYGVYSYLKKRTESVFVKMVDQTWKQNKEAYVQYRLYGRLPQHFKIMEGVEQTAKVELKQQPIEKDNPHDQKQGKQLSKQK